jgi:hypothetical protein
MCRYSDGAGKYLHIQGLYRALMRFSSMNRMRMVKQALQGSIHLTPVKVPFEEQKV